LYAVQGGSINELTNWTVADGIQTEGDWTIELLAEKLGGVPVA
jgi:hypothetical protein